MPEPIKAAQPNQDNKKTHAFASNKGPKQLIGPKAQKTPGRTAIVHYGEMYNFKYHLQFPLANYVQYKPKMKKLKKRESD
jgi:hypothetical protein